MDEGLRRPRPELSGIRYVLVPGHTDAPEPIDGLARLLSGFGNVDRVDVLSFHKIGAAKDESWASPSPCGTTPCPNPP
ncbi:hypothetical protein ACWEBX_30500 [Streptomyces sp. NPDC005070]